MKPLKPAKFLVNNMGQIEDMDMETGNDGVTDTDEPDLAVVPRGHEPAPTTTTFDNAFNLNAPIDASKVEENKGQGHRALDLVQIQHHEGLFSFFQGSSNLGNDYSDVVPEAGQLPGNYQVPPETSFQNLGAASSCLTSTRKRTLEEIQHQGKKKARTGNEPGGNGFQDQDPPPPPGF